MKSVEANARTRQEAIQQGLDELGVELHEVEIEILDEGSAGFLGIGKRDVSVRIVAEHLEDDQHGDPPDDVGNRNDQETRDTRGGQRGGGGRGGNRSPRAGQRSRGNRESNRDGSRARGNRDGAPPRTGQKRSATRGNQGGSPPKEKAAKPAPRPKRKERTVAVDRDAAEVLGKSASALLNEIIGKMGVESTVSNTLNEDDNVLLSVESEDSALLIGRKGRNLNAMQFLINRMMLSREDPESVDRIVVDVEGYLQRRKESLEEMALSMAQRAKETGRSLRVKPLSPPERRIIHLVLEDDDEVKTYSHGSAADRRVVIVPEGADPPDNRRPNRRPRPRNRQAAPAAPEASPSSANGDDEPEV